MSHRQKPHTTERARKLRVTQTDTESLLWYALRGRRLCGLKFRRQFPIEPYIVDFACVEKRLVVELDGAYHDRIEEDDRRRQSYIESRGWNVIRFASKDVFENAEAVAIAIARHLGFDPELRERKAE